MAKSLYTQPPKLVQQQIQPPALQLQSGPKGSSAKAIYKRYAPAVVYIEAAGSSGSGFIITESGQLLTNAHVVGSEKTVQVALSSGRRLSGSVISSDRSLDVALVKLSAAPKVTPLRLGSSSKLQVGEAALAIGNPFGLEQTLTVGVISALQRSIKGLDGYTIPNVIQTDAAINPGNSGGPLLNSAGLVVGINSQIVTGGGKGSVGIGFAAPIDAVKKDLSSLRSGKVRRPAWLGVTGVTLDQSTASSLGLPSSLKGVVVTSVAAGSPAAKAGIVTGAVIESLGGKEVIKVEQLPQFIGELSAGQKIEILFRLPSGKQKRAKVTISARPVG